MIQIDIDMPKQCGECPLCVDYDCIIHKRVTDEYYDTLEEQYAHCPLTMPSVQPRMKGRWAKGINENGVTTSLFCSECNYENKHWYEWNYCPHCGADMRGEPDGQENNISG